MAPPALSTRDTRTSLYTYPPTLALSILSSGSRYYSLAPALPTHGSMMLDLPLYIYISVSTLRFSDSRFCFSPPLDRTSPFPCCPIPSPRLTVFLIPFPVPRVFYIAPRLEGCCIERTIR